MNDRQLQLLFDKWVGPSFAFLTDDEGFTGPERRPGWAFYYSARVSVTVGLGGLDGLETHLRGIVNDLDVAASLSCLYVAVGLGPAQDVSRTARTTHTLQKSLASQALALRALLPTIRGPRRDELLWRCHGR